MASFKNIFCGCAMWVGSEGLIRHARSPRHAAWATTQGRRVVAVELRPLPPGVPSWKQVANG